MIDYELTIEPCYFDSGRENNPGFNHEFRYKGTYLHGKIEGVYGYDIFSFNKETSFVDGVNLITSKRHNDLLFIAMFDVDEHCNINPSRGFLVLADDYGAIFEALEEYYDNALTYGVGIPAEVVRLRSYFQTDEVYDERLIKNYIKYLKLKN